MNCVDYLLQEHLAREGDFILGRNTTLSYPQLIERVLKLSGWFQQNIGQGNNVILMLPNSALSVVAYLAIMKSGNVVVPLNPAMEEGNFKEIAACSAAQCMVASQQVARRLSPSIEIILCEAELEDIMQHPQTPLWSYATSEAGELAQIIFTSGSTAKPKGVMLSHRNIIANTDSIVAYLNLTDTDIIEIVLPFYYCYGLSLLHTHLKVGGSVVLNNTFIFLNSVLDDLQKYKCTGFAGVPSHFQILLRKSESFKTQKFPNLKYVTQAGGKLHNAFIKEFCACHPTIDFIVMYGQTEATARLSYLPPNRLKDKLGSLGKGIPGVELRVVNKEGKTVKAGEVGEIIAKGDNVMMGYFEDPEETAETLKKGWLYTGDLATVDDEGFIFHSARRKDIMKVGGRRVSPKEIEEVIVGINGVIDCTVEAIADDLQGEAVKATVVLNKNHAEVTALYIKKVCADSLSIYKVPKVIEFLSDIKVSATGKKVKG
ncbi:class I adenylate-forming enzyme family protein [Carboxylicivirga taeanensis]|uniref:class I adenylate-forming enzyme family protein n=1 Tax=Carboxylicivirga taeanensis TaxID=1416875 RepID=UPI003F6DC19D